ncbi:MAG: CBS domain-containing protein [Bacteroidota bacterium]
MTVQNLFAPALALSTADTVADALARLEAEAMTSLPVVDEAGKLVAVVSEVAMLEHPDARALLGSLGMYGAPVSAEPETHVFDAAHLMREHDLASLPVAESDGTYAGLVVRRDVFGQLAHMLATEEDGAIVVAEVGRHDVSLAQMAHLVEGSGVRILSISTEDDVNSGKVRITLKLNVTDTARVRHLLAHHGIGVVGVFDEAEADLEARAAEFIRYLEV